MTTGTGILIGAAVIVGGVVVYKLVSKPDPVATAAKSTASSAASTLNGFVTLGTSVLNYFGKRDPAPQAVPTSKWDSSADLLLPDKPGGTTTEESTRNDWILA